MLDRCRRARPPHPNFAGRAALLASAVCTCLALHTGCSSSDAPGAASTAAQPSEDDRILAQLRPFEEARRAAFDFARAPSSDHLLGADPYVIRAVSADRYIGALRGADALVLLDDDLHELSRIAAPTSPTGLAVQGDTAFSVGERTSEVRSYGVLRNRLEMRRSIVIEGARALRDVAVGPNGTLYAVEEAEGRLFTLVPNPAAPSGYDTSAITACAGAFRVARTKNAVLVDCLFAHTIAAYRTDAHGRPEGKPALIENDGPLWSFAAIDDGASVVVASGGAENKPLDRTHGSFENVDSFVYLDRLTWDGEPRTARIAAINVSEHDVLVPKALSLTRRPDGWDITATGYGGEAFASILVPDPPAPPQVLSNFLPPGTNAFVERELGGMIIANPLLDQWILYRTEHLAGLSEHVPGPGDAERSAASRLGEALIFTKLIAPWNRADGAFSRFTCETCHFEGYVDGRTHATGRGEVRATTKPLLGLFGNRPHFSRALDPDLATLAQNEFRAAGARSDHSPVFDLSLEQRGWLQDLGVTEADLGAVPLRRAFMAFLMDFSHRPSALGAGRHAFTDLERRGAEAFRDHCERCHEARASTEVATSRVPFEAWETAIFSDAAPLVWGQARYEKTGVLPYVHAEGARVPSLRRLYKKQPYFTNGTAKSLAEVLSRARFDKDAFFHDSAPAAASLGALGDGERAAIEAFLRLL